MEQVLWLGLYALLSIVGLITFLIVIVKLFKTEGALKGILGLICGIYPFIWGWIRHRELKITKIMAAWTFSMVGSIAVSFMLISSGLLSLFGVFQSASDIVTAPPALTQQISKRPGPKAVSKPVKVLPKPKAIEKPVPKPLAGYDLEMKKLNDLIKQDGMNADAHYNRALLYEEKNNYLMAEKDYTKAIEINSKHTDAYYNRGTLLAKLKKYELALKDFDACLKLSPTLSEAYCNRGNVYYQLGKTDLAVGDYTSALKISPNDPDLYYNRAVVYLSIGQNTKAMSDFKRADALGHEKAKHYVVGQSKKTNGTATASHTSSVLWKKDLTNVKIPGTAARGMIHGETFVANSAELANGILTIRDGEDFFPNHAVMIFLFLKEGETPERKSYLISQTNASASPHIHMKWKPANSKVPKTKVFMKDYSMRLDLGSIKNGQLPGKIYLCLPDEMKSVVAGIFTAVVK